MKIFRYRPEIDGVRAIAVLSVIIYHLNADWLPGGYLGVDIFFVLSGYLITTLLVLEYDKDQRIDLAGFWARRIRRLMPALFIVLSAIALYFALSSSNFTRIGLRSDLFSALFYVANWNFIAEGQSYFTGFESASYVRHTWSLAIEEQFYLIWPLTVYGIFRLQKQKYIPILLSVVIGTSVFLMGFLYTSSDPSRAYFGTDTRVHQILLGVTLAFLLTGRMREKTLRIGYRLMPVAVAGIILCFIFLKDQASFYYQGGSFLVALSTVVLIAGLEGGHPVIKLLQTKLLVSIGLISYGLYLWHWPVIQLVGKEIGPSAHAPNAIIAVAITFTISTISYRYVEKPVRLMKKLFKWNISPRIILVSLPVVSGLVLIIILVSTMGTEKPEWASAGQLTQIPTPESIEVPTPESIGSLIDEPSTDTSRDDSQVRNDSEEEENSLKSENPVVNPSADNVEEKPELLTVGIVGDSVAVSLLPGLRTAALDEGFKLIEAAIPACPIGYKPLYSDDGVISPYADNCLSNVQAQHEILINDDNPDIIIWHDLQSVFARRNNNDALLSTGSSEWESALHEEWTTVLSRFQTTGAEIFLLLPPLRSTVSLETCLRYTRCVDIQFQDESIRNATLTWWETVRDSPNVYTVELDSYLCPLGNPCPEKINGVAVRVGGNDQTHFTEDGAEIVAVLLMEMISEKSSTFN
ncbi:MAG: acyltransferase family protein [Acidimicrobiales bacterium]|nr:acyltransferase family protein [Acidimicrobiales bacterium]